MKICLRCEENISEDEKIWVNEDNEFAHDECIGWDDLQDWESYNFDYGKC